MFVSQQLHQADTDGDGQVSFGDFCDYYQAMSLSRARLELRSTMGMEAESKPSSCSVQSASIGCVSCVKISCVYVCLMSWGPTGGHQTEL